MIKVTLPESCPSCGRILRVKRLACGECGTAVEGDFGLPLLARLRPEEQAMIVNLVKIGRELERTGPDIRRVLSDGPEPVGCRD